MKKFIIENWFKIVVIIIILLTTNKYFDYKYDKINIEIEYKEKIRKEERIFNSGKRMDLSRCLGDANNYWKNSISERNTTELLKIRQDKCFKQHK